MPTLCQTLFVNLNVRKMSEKWKKTWNLEDLTLDVTVVAFSSKKHLWEEKGEIRLTLPIFFSLLPQTHDYFLGLIKINRKSKVELSWSMACVFDLRPPQISETYHKKTVYVVTWGPSCHDNKGPNEHWMVYSCGDGVILQHNPSHLDRDAKNFNRLVDKSDKPQVMCPVISRSTSCLY